MNENFYIISTIGLLLFALVIPIESNADVWIPEDEFTSYIDANGLYTVIGAIKNSEEFSVIPTIIININDDGKLISKSFDYVPISPSKELPFKIKFPEISHSATLLEPTVTFTPTQKTPLKIEVLYDDTLIQHDDGHLTGRIINNGDSTAYNVKVFAIVHGFDSILDMAQNIEMIEKIEPGEIKHFSMYPDPSVTSEINYYSCFAPSDTTIVPVTAMRNDEKFFFRYDAGTWYYDARFNEAGTELTMKTQTSFSLDTYASFEFPYYSDNEKFQVYVNEKKKESIQSIDEMGNWHVSFGVGPRETGILKITGFEEDWKPIESAIIPNWIRNTAEWWSDDRIGDDDFVHGLQFLIDEKILIIPNAQVGSTSSSNQIPEWIKFNAGWWANGLIDDDSFVQGIQYIIKEGIMRV